MELLNFILNEITDKHMRRFLLVIFFLALLYTISNAQPLNSPCAATNNIPINSQQNEIYLRTDNCSPQWGSIGYLGPNTGAANEVHNNSLWFDGQCTYANGYKQYSENPLCQSCVVCSCLKTCYYATQIPTPDSCTAGTDIRIVDCNVTCPILPCRTLIGESKGRGTVSTTGLYTNSLQARLIHADSIYGTVIGGSSRSSFNCDSVDSCVAGRFWGVNGNSGTNPATQFIGVTDTNKLTIKADSGRIVFDKKIGIYSVKNYDNDFYYYSTNGNNLTFHVNAKQNKAIVTGIFQYQDTGSTFGIGKVLTSDASGLASWQAPSCICNLQEVTTNNDTLIADADNYIVFLNGTNGLAGNIENLGSDVAFTSLSSGIGTRYRANAIENYPSTQTISIPDTNGTIVLSVNNVSPNIKGNITLSVGQLPNVKDTLADILTGTVILTNNANNVVVASATITATTIAFPTGTDGDIITIDLTRPITTLTGLTGAQTSTITTTRKTTLIAGGSQTFFNIGGNWY